jgi:hypothetical protein
LTEIPIAFGSSLLERSVLEGVIGAEQADEDLFISSLTVAEIRRGIYWRSPLERSAESWSGGFASAFVRTNRVSSSEVHCAA